MCRVLNQTNLLLYTHTHTKTFYAVYSLYHFYPFVFTNPTSYEDSRVFTDGGNAEKKLKR